MALEVSLDPMSKARRSLVVLALATTALYFACEGSVNTLASDAGGSSSPDASHGDAQPAPDAALHPADAAGAPDASPIEPRDANPISPPDTSPVVPPDASPVEPLDASTPAQCAESYNVPPVGLSGWSPILSQDGVDTLSYDGAQHSHDDHAGAIGFCPAQVGAGRHYLKLVSARFETDQSPPDQHCVTDYQAADPVQVQYGCCWSGGNRHIYVEVRDQTGLRLSTAGFDAFFYGNTVQIQPDPMKPLNEFPMNFPINGGGNKYGARARYTDPTEGLLPSDAVTNMRLPGNHHVTYLLTFQLAQK
jgi:hypothetical protein